MEIDKLREQWDRAVERDRPADAVAVLAALERLEPEEPRWSQRLGEVLRRLGKKHEAEEAFVRATEGYVKQGFLPRAIAMAKLVTSLNPARADLLARFEPPKPAPAPAPSRLPAAAPPPLPAAAKASTPTLPSPAPRTPPAKKPVALKPAEDSGMDEIRFFDLDGPPSLDIVMDDLGCAPFDLVPEAPTSSVVPARAERASLPEMRAPSIDRFGAMATFRLFAGLPRGALLDLANAAELAEFVPTAMIMMRDEPAYALYALIDGTVRVRVHGGDELRLGEGDVIGEGCLLEEGQRQADVRAETHVMALRIEKHKLDAVTERHAEVGEALFQLLARRLVANLMQASPLFAAFDPQVRLELAQMFEIRRAEPDTVLSERGKRSDGLYLLLSGNVTSTSDAGETRIARGSAFGHGSLLSAAPASMTIKTESEAVLLRLPAARFSSLAAVYPPILAHLAETADELPRASLVP